MTENTSLNLKKQYAKHSFLNADGFQKISLCVLENKTKIPISIIPTNKFPGGLFSYGGAKLLEWEQEIKDDELLIWIHFDFRDRKIYKENKEIVIPYINYRVVFYRNDVNDLTNVLSHCSGITLLDKSEGKDQLLRRITIGIKSCLDKKYRARVN